MPYIIQDYRNILDPLVKPLADEIGGLGELNYCITKLCLSVYPKETYDNFNSLIGVLECVKQELYRKRVAPYEDEKCKQNGEVY